MGNTLMKTNIVTWFIYLGVMSFAILPCIAVNIAAIIEYNIGLSYLGGLFTAFTFIASLKFYKLFFKKEG